MKNKMAVRIVCGLMALAMVGTLIGSIAFQLF